MDCHLLGGGSTVILAEEAEERAGEVLRVVEWGDRAFLREVFGAHDDATAPEVGDGIERGGAAGCEVGVAATRARPEDTNPAVRIGLRAEKAGAGSGIADHLVIGDAPFGPDFRADILRRALGNTAIEVGGDGRIAARGELAGRLFVPGVPAGHVMDEDDRRERAAAQGARAVGVDRVAVGSGDDDGLGEHAFVLVGAVGHGAPPGRWLRSRNYSGPGIAGARAATRR